MQSFRASHEEFVDERFPAGLPGLFIPLTIIKKSMPFAKGIVQSEEPELGATFRERVTRTDPDEFIPDLRSGIPLITLDFLPFPKDLESTYLFYECMFPNDCASMQ